MSWSILGSRMEEKGRLLTAKGIAVVLEQPWSINALAQLYLLLEEHVLVYRRLQVLCIALLVLVHGPGLRTPSSHTSTVVHTRAGMHTSSVMHMFRPPRKKRRQQCLHAYESSDIVSTGWRISHMS